jgi:D-arabinose 1-dehydrogenase-like Zn-dependent alcohol dehydrogenase
MKAIVQDEYGSADVLRLEDVETPVAGRGEVLIHVIAASAFIGDWHVITGTPYAIRLVSGLGRPKQRVRGQDMAGQVEAVGREATSFRLGDEVFGVGNGTFAEYATARTDKIAPKPANLGFEEAATVPTTGCTALQGIRDVGKVQPGQSVLVIGAAGGVGSFAVQIAKAFGAHVTGVCSTSKVELVRSIGADEVIDYTREDIVDGTRRYDLIFDTAGNRDVSYLAAGHDSEGDARSRRWRRNRTVARDGSRRPREGYVAVRRAEDDELPLASEGGRPHHSQGTDRGGQDQADDRVQVPARRGARGDRRDRSWTRSRKGRHHRLNDRC